MKNIPKPNFIQKLQALDEGRKQKVLVGVTIAIMIIVIYFWLSYFNGIVAPTPASTDVPQSSASGESFWGQVAGEFKNIYKTFSNPGQYKINGQGK